MALRLREVDRRLVALLRVCREKGLQGQPRGDDQRDD
jgi:hypothetical protein